MYVYFSTHDFTFKLNFYTNFIQIFLCKFMQNYYIQNLYKNQNSFTTVIPTKTTGD